MYRLVTLFNSAHTSELAKWLIVLFKETEFTWMGARDP